MRKVILFNMITLDGLFEGPGDDIDWHNVDEEFNHFAIEQTGSAGGLIFGRKTYQLMESYWPTPQAKNDDPEVAQLMNDLPKYVFSNSLQTVTWSRSTLMSGDAAEEITRLKEQPGNDLFIFGSADLAAYLTRKGVIDEYRLMVNPVILGRGKPMFDGLEQPLKLKLLRTRTFANGNILLVYQPERPGSGEHV